MTVFRAFFDSVSFQKLRKNSHLWTRFGHSLEMVFMLSVEAHPIFEIIQV
jgi:hypothetical protein